MMKSRQRTSLSRLNAILIVGVCGLTGAPICTAAEAPASQDEPVMNAQADSLKITVLYDNYVHDSRLQTGWGFAALLEYGEHTVLFDTGADGPALLANMSTLSIDPHSIGAVVLSHAHGDHTGGLDALLATGVRPPVYLHPSFPEEFKQRIGAVTTVIETEAGQYINDRISTTGEVEGGIPEQALIIETGRGLVVVTGCAHPGVARMAATAMSLRDTSVHLVLGGYHLRSTGPDQLRALIAEFRRLGIENVAPTHCTGDPAIEMFAAEYGDDFIRGGAGLVISVEAPQASGSR
jgi:7,8-dihydropterin-6-yl-methyl-4-(beta-D-ribofuranosyl)aminobenzene 5'-phosphate synthase